MKRVFYLGYKFYDYEKQIKDILEKNGFEVEFFNYSSFRKIKNPILNLYNRLYYKKFKNSNLKDIYVDKNIIKFLKTNKKKYDYFLKIGTINLKEETLNLIKEKIEVLISHYWDSIKTSEEKLLIDKEKKYFDKISSYDLKDCIRYELEYLPNFYTRISKNQIQNKTDVYTIMSDIRRKEFLEKIGKNLQENNIRYDINLVVKKENIIKSNIINITDIKISMEEMLEKSLYSKTSLEILHSGNNGSTFRAIDCIGLKKKLITNNKNIINEDFYNPNNILILDEENINIPKEFIDSPYEDLPKEIFEKYSLKNWAKQLLEIKNIKEK